MSGRFRYRLALYIHGLHKVCGARFLTHAPFFISHLITSRCNANCQTCMWKGVTEDEEDTGKILDFYGQAKRVGFISTVFWGGEPLMREDMIDILTHCKRIGFVCGLITNGYFLPERCEELSELLDFLIVSIDIPSEQLDALRGVEGIFTHATMGIDLFRQANPESKVIINAVVSRLNYRHLDDLIDYAQERSLSLNLDAMVSGPPDIDALRLSSSLERRVFSKFIVKKRKGAPIVNSFSYLQMFAEGNQDYRCHRNEIAIRVLPNGDLTNCLFPSCPIGNVYEEDLVSLLNKPSYRFLQKIGTRCRRCVDAGTVESSLFWGFKPEVVFNTLRLFLT